LSEEPLLMSFALRASARSLGFLMGYIIIICCYENVADKSNTVVTKRAAGNFPQYGET